MSASVVKKLIYSLLILIIFGGFSFLYFELNRVKGENADLALKLESADVRTEGIENKIVTLKEQGYVEADTAADFANAILPSVVFIALRLDVPADESVLGTGFFVTSRGYIATAKHVISEVNLEDIVIRDTKGNQYAVLEIVTDSSADVGLVKIETAENHPVASFGYFENLEIGSKVGVIGFNPGFTAPLLHTGTVSALGVDPGGSELFTINAFVNKGNSGSPVFSLTTGRILGILSTRQSETQARKLLNPEEYQSGVSLGGMVDPVQFSALLYNETVRLVEEVSQVGIGVVYSVEIANRLLNEESDR